MYDFAGQKFPAGFGDVGDGNHLGFALLQRN
jgi:hypothetical protein